MEFFMDITMTHDWILDIIQISLEKSEIKLFLQYDSREVEFTITEFTNYSVSNEMPWGHSIFRSINCVSMNDNEIKEVLIELQTGDTIKINYFGEILSVESTN
jgi:Mg2+/citrate symporter